MTSIVFSFASDGPLYGPARQRKRPAEEPGGASFAKRGGRSGGAVAEDRFHLEELFQAELAALAAVAGLLVAAERPGGVAGRIVGVHGAGAHPRRDPPGLVAAAGLTIESRRATGRGREC